MSLSAFVIGRGYPKVWVVSTEDVAQDDVPATLPIGSVVLTAQEALKLGQQMIAASAEAQRRSVPVAIIDNDGDEL